MAPSYKPFSGYIPFGEYVGNNPAVKAGSTFDPLSSDIDLQWGGGRDTNDQKFSNYYDYYFSGEDIKVYIDGLFDPKDELDIAGFTFSIKQEKQPVYGFWSYNFDTVMNGTRLVAGRLSVYTRYPRRITDLLEKAAEARVNSVANKPNVNSVISLMGSQSESLSDEENIQKYWAYSQLDRVTTDPALKSTIDGQHNIFSAHPPFNLIIMYGVQDSSLTPTTSTSNETSATAGQNSVLDKILATDINQRLVKHNTGSGSGSSPMKIVLQNVNLVSMSASFEPGGQPLVETYDFIARDYYFTEADGSKNPYAALKTVVPNQQNTPQQTIDNQASGGVVNINVGGIASVQ